MLKYITCIILCALLIGCERSNLAQALDDCYNKDNGIGHFKINDLFSTEIVCIRGK